MPLDTNGLVFSMFDCAVRMNGGILVAAVNRAMQTKTTVMGAVGRKSSTRFWTLSGEMLPRHVGGGMRPVTLGQGEQFHKGGLRRPKQRQTCHSCFGSEDYNGGCSSRAALRALGV